MPAQENFDDRCRKLYEALGWCFDVVERRIRRQAKKDLFGFADYLAFHDELKRNVAIQTTTKESMTHHLNKILDEPRARRWIRAGNEIDLVIWTSVFTPGPDARLDWSHQIFSLEEKHFDARSALRELTKKGA